MALLRRNPSEAKLAKRAAEQAAARARTEAPADEDEDEDDREPTGQPSPGAVPDTTAAVERAYEEVLASSSEWERFSERVETGREGDRAELERLAELERRIERARSTAKHAPTWAKRQAVEKRIDRLEDQHSALFASLHAAVTDDELGGPWEPIRCRFCQFAFPDRRTAFDSDYLCPVHSAATAAPTYP